MTDRSGAGYSSLREKEAWTIAHTTGNGSTGGHGGHTGGNSSLLSGGWRVETQRKVDELGSLTTLLQQQQGHTAVDAELWKGIRGHLDTARQAAVTHDERSRWRKVFWPADTASVDATLGGIDAAEASLLRMAPPDFVLGQLPTVLAQVNRYLPKDDPRRSYLDDVAHESRKPGFALDHRTHDALVNAYHAAGSQRRRDLVRAGSFFGVLVGTTICLAVLVVVIGAVGLAWPRALPVCFQPQSNDTFSIVCPTGETRTTPDGAPVSNPRGDVDDGIAATVHGGDLALIELAGLLAAGLAATGVLRNMRGTSIPYRLPLGLALLKLPAGAVTAVVGLLLMRGGFVPGLSALDTSAQIIAWALIFGYAQQLVTGLIDRQASGVLSDVGGRGASGEREPKST